MENTTQFDLDGGLRKWSEDLAAQPGLTPEARNELETHLRDTVKELCGRGLNQEESFWLACRRIGAPRQLGEEFAKANPSSVWRMRALWVAAALLAVRLIQGAFAGVSGSLTFFQLHHWVTWWVEGLGDGLRDTGVGDVIGAVVVIWLTAVIARRPSGTSARLWRFFFRSRWRFMMIGTLSVLAIFALESWNEAVRRSLLAMHPDPSFYFAPRSQDAFFKLMFPSALVILIGWLIPSDRPAKASGDSRLSRLTKA